MEITMPKFIHNYNQVMSLPGCNCEYNINEIYINMQLGVCKKSFPLLPILNFFLLFNLCLCIYNIGNNYSQCLQ